jgi:hypothetical protein
MPSNDPERLLMRTTRYPAGTPASRDSRAQLGHGGQAFGLVTERDERMKCLYVVAAARSPNRERLTLVPSTVTATCRSS